MYIPVSYSYGDANSLLDSSKDNMSAVEEMAVKMKEKEHRQEMTVEIGMVETPIMAVETPMMAGMVETPMMAGMVETPMMAVETPIMAAGENERRLVSWYRRWGRKSPTPV